MPDCQKLIYSSGMIARQIGAMFVVDDEEAVMAESYPIIGGGLSNADGSIMPEECIRSKMVCRVGEKITPKRFAEFVKMGMHEEVPSTAWELYGQLRENGSDLRLPVWAKDGEPIREYHVELEFHDFKEDACCYSTDTSDFFFEVYYNRDEHEGKIAIENAVSIGNSVYAGSNYFGTQGSNVNDWTHHDATGYTNIYIDGTEYNTASNSGNSMNIGGGVFGSGTHCEAGLSGHNVLMREYGHRNTENHGHGDEFTEATRSLTTIQRCQNLLLDNVNINLTGLNDINTTYSTSKIYSVVKVDEVMYLTNASALSVGGEAGPAYMDSIHCLRSMHLNIPAGTTIYDELYALEDGDLTPAENDETKQHYDNIQNLEWIAVNPLTGGENTAENARLYYVTSAPTTPLDYEQENVILFNNFSQLWVRYHKDEPNTKYGELQGFIRMDSDYEPYGTESFAFARPKITGAKNNNILTGNPAHPYLYENDNVVDGGFLSYKVDNLGVDYEHGYNFFTLQDNLGGWDYPADGDDGGDDYTKTKQYPYILYLSKEQKEWMALALLLQGISAAFADNLSTLLSCSQRNVKEL